MSTQCSIALLESALAGNLPADDEGVVQRHLEECEACCAALERMVGGPAWCQEAAALLAQDELDAALPGHPLVGVEEWSDADFTVEHLEPADEPGALGRLGGYDVLEIIGRGGMGVVLKGFDRELKRCVAIKVLSPHLAQSSLARKRFAREAQAAAVVVHPHVLAIHQVQPNGRLPFLVMPLVAGESLAQRLAAHGRLELKEILRIGMQAAAGLAAAHEQGLVHRDVKPANILLDKGVERAVLTDFGLARAADDVTLTRWGVIAGTPQYMSPEQARGEALDGRSDLFSLGCVLYEMATGVSPFRADSVMATMRRLVDDTPQAMASLNPELPPWFVAIVDRLLEKDPSQRFDSAKEVSELLESCLAHLQQPSSVSLPTVLPKPAHRRAWLPRVIRFQGVLAAIAALGAGLLAVLALSTAPPDIAGEWSGEDWGRIALTKTSAVEYTGTYSDTAGKRQGEIQLKWSRIERRFNGTWREGEDRFGELSIRLVGDEILGAHTTDAKSKINPATPKLADLKWTRSGPAQGNHATADEVADRPERSYPNVIVDAKKAKEQQETWGRLLGVPVEITNSIGMKLVLIPPGEFMMGASGELIKEELKAAGAEDWYKDRLPGEGPRHRVRITKPFYCGAYVVTQEEYRRVTGANPSEFSAAGGGKDKVAGRDTKRFPVENVSWDEAVEFCRKLSEMPEEKAAGRIYQLPSEAQWEYACRAGSTGRFHFSSEGDAIPTESEINALSAYGWFDGNSGGMTHAVGGKKPNAWGLFDMHGNVWEWCQDWYGKDYYAKSPADDPTGPLGGAYRVCRGGSCRIPAWRCGAASRGNREPGIRRGGLGLRVAQVLKGIRLEGVQGGQIGEKNANRAKSMPADAQPRTTAARPERLNYFTSA
jgi:formylglycine-generating enzyme required for sulfatase activity/serine/threonine protein kinase